MKNLIIVIVSFSLFTACTNRFRLMTSEKAAGTYKSDSYKLAVISLNIAKTDSDYLISISNSRLVNGSEKSTYPESEKWTENDFICFILDRNTEIIDTLIIVQPLHPRYEYPGENGIIGSKVVELEMNEVLLRFPYSSVMRYLQFEKVEKNNKLKGISTLEIPFH